MFALGKAVLALALLLWPARSFGQGQEDQEVPAEVKGFGSCGLVTRYASTQIGDTCLQDARNIYLDEDAGIVRRKGYAKYNATAITDSKSVRGMWPFRATDGTDYLVVLSSRAIFQSDGDGTFTEIPGLGTLSASQDMDAAQCLGKLWFVNGSDTMAYWDGTSTHTVSGAPTCSAIDCFRNRVVLGNCSGTLSQLRLSGELDGTNFTIPSTPVSSSPAVMSIGGVNDGNRLQCIMGVYQDVLVTGKTDSAYGLYGFDRRDFAVRELSREVGCIDNRSAREKQGSLYWLSKRGLEKMTGPNITRVSDPIRDLVDTIIAAAGNTRSDTDTSQADFQAGNLTVSGPGARMSATISPGNVVPTTFTVVDTSSADFVLGTLTNLSTTSAAGSLTISQASSGTFSNAGAEVGVSTNWASASNHDQNPSCNYYGNFGWLGPGSQVCGESMIFTVRDSAGNTLRNQSVELSDGLAWTEYTINTADLAKTMVAFEASVDGQKRHSVPFIRPQNIKFAVKDYDSSTSCQMCWDVDERSFTTTGNIVSRTFDTAFSTPTYGAVTGSMSSSAAAPITFEVQASTASDGGGFESLVSQNNAAKFAGANKRYFRYKASFSVVGTTNTPAQFDDLTTIAATTATFISQCTQTGSAISSWGLFQCNQTPYEGTVSYFVSTGATCNEAIRSTNTWTAQSNNAGITIATAPFVAYKADWSYSLFVPTGLPAHHDCTFNWNEGTSRPSVSAEVYRDRYYLAYTSGTSGTPVNDNLLVLDSKDQWALHDAPNCAAMGIYNRALYCGDSADSGLAYRMDIGQTDDGAAFTSRIKTKDFDLGSPYKKKILKRIYYDLGGLPDPTYNMELTPSYTLDASTDTVSLENINLGEDYGRFIAAKVPARLDNNTTGRWFSFDLQHSGTTGPWKLFGLKFYFTPLKED